MSNDSMNINDLENEAALIEHVSKSAEVTVEQMGVDVDALRADVDMMRAELNELRAVVNQFSHPSTWGN